MGRALVARGWRMLHHDARVVGVQVDWIARAPGGTLTLVEVKMPSRLARLSRSQRARLFRAAAALSTIEPVELVFATLKGGQLLVLPVDGLTV